MEFYASLFLFATLPRLRRPPCLRCDADSAQRRVFHICCLFLHTIDFRRVCCFAAFMLAFARLAAAYPPPRRYRLCACR